MSIALTTHKVAAVLLALAMVFSVAFVTPASAQTVSELTAQINSLLATIAGLQTQLGAISGGTTTTTGASCPAFTLTHQQGSTGGEVMAIQKFLNANGFTVATVGAGSPGSETSTFGPATKAAVMKFQSAKGITPVAGYWGPITRAAANSMCTGGGTTTTPVPTGTGITVSAAAQPGNSLAPQKAARVPFTKFVVTNNSSVAQTITGVVVQRGGLSVNTDFANVVLLDENGMQVGIERVINSNDQATIGESMVLQPGQSRTLTVAANIATSGAGNGDVATFSVIAINTTATITGSLPIVGAQHTINTSLAIGTATVARGIEDPNGSQNKEIGTNDYKFTSIKVTAGSTEDVRLTGLRFNQSGSATAADLADVKVTVDGTTYPVTLSADGKYYTVNFGSGIVVKEGFSKEVIIAADIVSGTNRTIAFDVYRLTDIQVVGETYGYGITPSAGTGFTSSTPVYDASVVTVLAGSFNSVSKSNLAPAANIAEQKADEILGAFTVDIKGEGITVQTLRVRADDGTSTWTADADDITNVTLVDQNGNVIAGPVDGNATNLTSPTALGSFTFSGVDFPAGVTTVYVKGQLGSDFANNDEIVLSTTPDATSDDWSSVTGISTGDSVTLPATTATANTMTVKAATLTATTSASEPATRSIVPGATDYIFAIATLNAANSGEDVKVTALVVEDTVTGVSSDVNDLLNVEIWANLTGGTANDSTRGDRFETRVADAEQFASTAAATEATISFSLDTHINIAKNTSVDIAVVADLSSSATAGAFTHSVSLDTDSGDVTAVGKTSGATVSVTPTGSGQAQTVSSGGTLTTSVDASSPTAALLLDDTINEQTVAAFRLAASNVEDLDVDSIKFTTSNTAVQKFVIYKGATKLGEMTNTGAPEFFFNDGAVTVPANSNVVLTVKAVMNGIDGTTVVNGADVAIVLDEAQTTGKSSGSAVDDTTNHTAATHDVYETYPTFAFDNTGVSTTLVNNTNHLLAKIKVTNLGDKDFTLQSSATNLLTVQVSASSDATASTPSITLKDEDGNVLDSNETFTSNAATEVTFDFDGAYTSDFTVAAGASKYLMIYGDTSDFDEDGNSVQVWLDDTAADLTFSIENTGAFTEGDYVFKGDVFGPAHVNP